MAKLMATEVARAIVEHVLEGKWLGASWPRYVLPADARVTQYQLDNGFAMAMATILADGWSVASVARWNWEDAAHAAELGAD